MDRLLSRKCTTRYMTDSCKMIRTGKDEQKRRAFNLMLSHKKSTRTLIEPFTTIDEACASVRGVSTCSEKLMLGISDNRVPSW